jgi:hypothetical protein
MLSAREVGIYAAAVDWLLELVASDEVAKAWAEPSALSRYSTGGVAAHALSGAVLRLAQLVEEPEPSDRRRVGVPEAFAPNRMAGPDDDDPLFVMLRSGSEQLAERGPAALLETCAAPYARLREVLPVTRAERAVSLVRVPEGQMSLRDYLQTRLLEIVVHGDDLVAGIEGWDPADPPADAVGVCLQVCLQLAQAQAGGLGALRAFTRAERAAPGSLRVL